MNATTDLDSSAILLNTSAHSSTEIDERLCVSTERSGYVPPSLPDGVVYAMSADEVVATMKLAAAYNVPVVPRGAGTGLAGGSAAQAGEVVLDLSRMNSWQWSSPAC